MARKVLLADDSVTAQNMGRRIMTDAGYEVITVNNGSAALKKIHESQPDLIVLDVYMPGYGGLEVCQRLKESEATMKIPVLLTVGKMEPFKVDEAKRVHADGHIIKPFDASELLSALTKLEDKIVPSENARGRRTKAEHKKSRASLAADPAATFDDSHTEQIQYLARVKQRRETPEEVAAEPAYSPTQSTDDATPASDEAAAARTQAALEAVSNESTASAPEEAVSQQGNQDAVTFAAGPIELEMNESVQSEKSSQEFEIQREVEIEHEFEPSANTEPASSTYEQLPELEHPPVVEISATETVEGLQTDPGLIAEESQSDFSQSPQAEPEQRWVAENVAHTSEEASSSLEEEMQQAQVEAEPETEPSRQEFVTEPTLVSETDWQRQPEPDSDSKEGAAFAAAASASESFAQTNAISASSSESEPPPAGSESSAAWDNWQRIRDTVITERATEAITESAAALADAAVSSQNDAPAAPSASDAAPTSQTVSGNDALSNIVDSVLAELKPRLLAEIAKQLAQDKK